MLLVAVSAHTLVIAVDDLAFWPYEVEAVGGFAAVA